MEDKEKKHVDAPGPSLAEFMEGASRYPEVLGRLETLSAQLEAVRAELEAVKQAAAGPEGEKPPVTWAQAKARRYVGVKEAAYLLDVSTNTVRRLLARGLLTCSSATRHKKIPVASLEEYDGRTVI